MGRGRPEINRQNCLLSQPDAAQMLSVGERSVRRARHVLEPREREAARERMLAGRPSEKFTEGESMVKVASAVGMSRPMLPVCLARGGGLLFVPTYGTMEPATKYPGGVVKHPGAWPRCYRHPGGHSLHRPARECKRTHRRAVFIPGGETMRGAIRELWAVLQDLAESGDGDLAGRLRAWGSWARGQVDTGARFVPVDFDAGLSERQRWALARARLAGHVTSAEVAARWFIGQEAARLELRGLVDAGLLLAVGHNRGRFYTLASTGYGAKGQGGGIRASVADNGTPSSNSVPYHPVPEATL